MRGPEKRKDNINIEVNPERITKIKKTKKNNEHKKGGVRTYVPPLYYYQIFLLGKQYIC